MQLGMVGLGRMGGNIVRRLMRDGHECVVFDRNPAAIDGARQEGATAAADLAGPCRRSSTSRARSGSCCRPARSPSARSTQLGDAAGAGRHHHRRRQHLLQGRHPPRQGAEGQGHPLCRRRHQRRRLGPGARLLPDDRRRQGDVVEHLDPIFADAGARRRRHSAHARPRGPRSARRARLHPLRAERRRPFRQDGPQRHRVRADAGLCRRLRHPADARPSELPADQRFDLNIAGHRRGLAARQRGLAPGCSTSPPSRWPTIRRSRLSPASSRIPARAAGRSWRRSRRRCRPTCCRPRFYRALPLARGRQFRRQAAVGDAQRVRRPCRAASRRREWT